jgi:hypothetical protein
MSAFGDSSVASACCGMMLGDFCVFSSFRNTHFLSAKIRTHPVSGSIAPVFPVVAAGLAVAVACALVPSGSALAATTSVASAAGIAARPARPSSTYTPMTPAQESVLKAKALASDKPDLGRQELTSERTRLSRTFFDPVKGTRVSVSDGRTVPRHMLSLVLLRS